MRQIHVRQQQPVSNLVTDMGELGRREPARKVNGADVAKFGPGIEHIGEGDFLTAGADLYRHIIIRDENVDLLRDIVSKQRRLGNAGDIMAGC